MTPRTEPQPTSSKGRVGPEPRTEAGRRLLRAYRRGDWGDPHQDGAYLIEQVRAIEQEAVGRLRAALSLARSMILSGEPMSEQAARTFDEAFVGQEAAALSSEPTPLDVERLAQVIAAAEGFPGQPSLKNRALAEYIVARLTPEPSDSA